MNDKELGVLLAVACLLQGIAAGSMIRKYHFNREIGITIGEMHELKRKCESVLPRNEKCVVIMAPPREAKALADALKASQDFTSAQQ